MSAPSISQLQHNAVIDFAHALVGASLNRLMHARDSAPVAAALQDVVDKLRRVDELGVETPLSLQIDRLHLCYEGARLPGPSLQARSLIEHCSQRGVAMLSFDPRVDAAELNRLFDLLLLRENAGSLHRGHRDAALLANGVRNVAVSLRDAADPDDRTVTLDQQGKAVQQYQDLASALHQNHRLASHDHELAVDAMAAAVERAVSDREEPSMLLALAMQDDVDRFTIGHSVRVALLALQVAGATDATREQLVRVGSAALMHDIGKSKVPPEILWKQGRLTEDEWRWMAQHPRLGAQILIEQHEAVDPRAIGAAFCHHLSPNGKGYPEAMLPAPPSATSRLVRVCDVFEALTAVRPYKHALTPIEAFAVMHRSVELFDPDWLRFFTRTLGLFPNGTRVVLTDGCEAIVTAQGEQVTTPTVQLLTGPDGADLDGRPETLQIGQAFEGCAIRIGAVSANERLVPMPEFAEPDADDAHSSHEACLAPHDHDH